MAQNPTFLSDVIARVQEAGHMPQMLARMIEIDDFNRTREVPIGDILVLNCVNSQLYSEAGSL